MHKYYINNSGSYYSLTVLFNVTVKCHIQIKSVLHELHCWSYHFVVP